MKAAANSMKSAAYPRRTRNEAEDFIFMGFMSESVVEVDRGARAECLAAIPCHVFGDDGFN
jgi:hypothetical protein